MHFYGFVHATAIRAKMTALELTELDLSYAPPYSSAKDPVNMAGFMIEDLESGKEIGRASCRERVSSPV